MSYHFPLQKCSEFVRLSHEVHCRTPAPPEAPKAPEAQVHLPGRQVPMEDRKTRRRKHLLPSLSRC